MCVQAWRLHKGSFRVNLWGIVAPGVTLWSTAQADPNTNCNKGNTHGHRSGSRRTKRTKRSGGGGSSSAQLWQQLLLLLPPLRLMLLLWQCCWWWLRVCVRARVHAVGLVGYLPLVFGVFGVWSAITIYTLATFRGMRALSDATLRFDLALGDRRRHAPKVAKNRHNFHESRATAGNSVRARVGACAVHARPHVPASGGHTHS